MQNGTNPFRSRRTYFDTAIWYKAKVYEANEKILSVVFSPNSAGYYKTTLPHRPKNPDEIIPGKEYYDDSAMVDFNNTDKYPMPNATFYCKNVGTFSVESNDVQDFLQIKSTHVQIETQDNVVGIAKNDYIFYNDCWWIIDSVQTFPIRRTQYYMKEQEYITTISLRR